MRAIMLCWAHTPALSGEYVAELPVAEGQPAAPDTVAQQQVWFQTSPPTAPAQAAHSHTQHVHSTVH